MCNLSQGIYNDGLAKGLDMGMAKGMAKGQIGKAIEVVKNLLNMGFSIDKALAVADIDRETYEKNKDM